jgi:hypothetical protein
LARAQCAILLAVLSAALAVSAFAPDARAQWTRPAGDRLTITTVSVHRLDSQAGRPDLIKEEVALYGEFGLTSAVTLIARSAVQSLREDVPVQRRVVVIDKKKTEILIPPEREFGVGGIELGARVRLRRKGPWVVSAQGVFGVQGSGENQINARFGEGGGDTDLRLQVGRGLGEHGFVAASGGWRDRRGADQDEIRLDLTAGRALGRGVHVFVHSYSVWSIQDGAGAPRDYSGHRLQASLVLPVSRRMRLQIGVLGTVRSRDMAREQAALVSLWRRF